MIVEEGQKRGGGFMGEMRVMREIGNMNSRGEKGYHNIKMGR